MHAWRGVTPTFTGDSCKTYAEQTDVDAIITYLIWLGAITPTRRDLTNFWENTAATARAARQPCDIILACKRVRILTT